MQKPLKNNQFLSLIEKSNSEYLAPLNGKNRKNIGQIFTPVPIARFMADMFDLERDKISILDPGAGTGILTAALCERLIHFKSPLTIRIDAYENDKQVLPYLKHNLLHIKQAFQYSYHRFEFNIINEDFIEKNSNFINSGSLFSNMEAKPSYDFIISNPPYYKLAKSHHHSLLMKKVVHGQPNIYFFFMALAAILLSKHGQLVFITPRSYFSGLYFKKFRKWFLKKIKPEHIHTFESRRETFNNEVLQETIIMKGIKRKSNLPNINISSSYNSNLDKAVKIKTDFETIIQPDDPEQIIHVPTSYLDIEILQFIRSWKNKFSDLGFRISTGPVVSFRATKHLSSDTYFDGQKKVPLLWMNHLKNYKVQFPNKNLKKPQTIKVSSESIKLLLKNDNYVLVKRFTSKEQKKRVYAACYSKNSFNANFIGIENHLNYIWKPSSELSTTEALGIMAILNSSIIDKYFRVLNGNTQVNATEINNLPFPSYVKIIEIGKTIESLKNIDDDSINLLVMKSLDISRKVKGLLN
jgi:adenine-specific DNA-methyltransferase